MNLKSNRGFTMMETLVSVVLLSLISLGVGLAISSANNNREINRRYQEDEYNARFALLFIAREAHKQVIDAEVDDDDGSLMLTLLSADGDEYETKFYLDDEKTLRCETDNPSTVFDEVNLKEFTPTVEEDSDGKKRRVNVKIVCLNGLKLETTVSINRIPWGESN